MTTDRLHISHLAFLHWLIDRFGYDVKYISRQRLGDLYGLSYEAVRNYMRILSKHGYLTIEQVTRSKHIYRINEKYDDYTIPAEHAKVLRMEADDRQKKHKKSRNIRYKSNKI